MSNEGLGRNSGLEKKSQNVTPEESMKSNVDNLPENEKKLINEIMVAKTVLREAYIDNMEGGFDGLNLALDGNYTSVNSVLNEIEANMFDLNKNDNNYKQFRAEVANLRSDIYNYELKDKNKVILSDLKALDTTAALFVSSLERSQIMPVKKEVKREDVKEVTPGIKSKEKTKEVVDADMNSILLKLDPSIDSFEVTTDMLNRSQEMRFVYSSEGYESIDKLNGDQILLKTLLKDLSAGLSTFEAMGAAYKNPTKEQLNSLTDIQVSKLIKIYQKTVGLKVDGKFGPSTYNSLVQSAEKSGYKIVDRSEMIKESDEYSKDDRYKKIRSGKVYSKKVRRNKVKNKLKQSNNWYERDAEYSKEISKGLIKGVYEMTDDELNLFKNLVVDRYVHHSGDVEEFVGTMNLSDVDKTQVITALNIGDQNFQTEALLKALKPAPAKDENQTDSKEEKTPTVADKALELVEDLVSDFQEGQKENKEEKSPVANESSDNGSSSDDGGYSSNGASYPIDPF
jgi:hypothetical protein